MDGLLFQAFIYLFAAIIAVPISKRLGLGSVLGYLMAGILIGPVIGLVGTETQQIQQFAEFGVVMMLFLVGLELEPRILWQMRLRLIGQGGLQIALTTVLIMAAAMLLQVPWTVALSIGLIFSLSSTAIVMQTLEEKGLSRTEGGRASFSILLFQDIAVIPMLALLPLLALPLAADTVPVQSSNAHHGGLGLVEGLSAWQHGAVVLAAILAVLFGGHYLSRPLFRFIAESRLREIFTASALLLVIGIALLMSLVGLSPALGTFLAGVVLANSEFKHELVSDIEPFKGLLLGLFFITVGAGIDFHLLSAQLGTILALALAVIGIKCLVLMLVARLFGVRTINGWLLALGLAQAGEFGFVLLNFSLENQVIPEQLSKLLSLVVALSMLLTPLLFLLYDKLILPRYARDGEKQADNIEEQGLVVVAGIGRFGQIVNRLLVASGIPTVVLDHEAEQVDRLRMAGVKSYYGDASRPDLLLSAGIDQARVFIVAIDDRERAVEMVAYVKQHYPQVTILARAFDVRQLYLLNKAGADFVLRELFDASLNLGMRALIELGAHPYKVRKMAQAFIDHDLQGIEQLNEVWDQNIDFTRNSAYLRQFIEHSETLSERIMTDSLQNHDRGEDSWTPPNG